ncbi:MAG: hypothetical protein KDC71_15825 [Acidobacteria bacterium]|nr:hypothetical protein [Acidobacteriota bacterium]
MQPEWTSERRGRPPSHIPPLDVFGPQTDSKKRSEAYSKYIGRGLIVAAVLVLAVVGMFVSKAFEHHETMLLDRGLPDKDPFEGLIQVRLLETKSLDQINKWFITRKPKSGFCFRAVRVRVTYTGEDTYRFNPYALHLFTEKTRYFIDVDWRSLDNPLKTQGLGPQESAEGWVFFESPCADRPLGIHLDGIVGALATVDWR